MGFINGFTSPRNMISENIAKGKESLLQLQNSLATWNTSSPAGKTRKRTRKSSEDHIDDVQSTPTKKRVSTRGGLNSPETTPIKQSSQISMVSSIDAAVTKLNFTINEESDRQAKTLPTPEATPQKDSRVIDVLKQEDVQLETSPQHEENKENITTASPNKHNIYTRGKTLFLRSSKIPFSTHLPERQVEAEALHNFLINHITSSQGTSLYISGPPGTGKTAQCKLSLSQFVNVERPHGGIQDVEVNEKDYKVGYSYVNCMTLGKAQSVFSELYQGLSGEKVHVKHGKDALYNFLRNGKADMSVVILDELDQLLQSRSDEVFTLFSWAVSCKIVLVGISNALDMVDRLLPRLKMNGLSPNTLSFLPYSADEIAKIITAKLAPLKDDGDNNNTAQHQQLFHPAAIQLCARKSASHTGDLRKAFDICRAAIEVVEREWKKSADSVSLQSLPMVKIQHIARITNTVFNGTPVSKLRGLNLSQKYLLCMLVRLESSAISQSLSVNGFYESYIRHVSKDVQIVGVLKKPEFLEVLSSLESNSLVRIHKTNKAFSEAKVSFGAIKQDLMEVIKGVYVLEKLMQNAM